MNKLTKILGIAAVGVVTAIGTGYAASTDINTVTADSIKLGPAWTANGGDTAILARIMGNNGTLTFGAAVIQSDGSSKRMVSGDYNPSAALGVGAFTNNPTNCVNNIADDGSYHRSSAAAAPNADLCNGASSSPQTAGPSVTPNQAQGIITQNVIFDLSTSNMSLYADPAAATEKNSGSYFTFDVQNKSITTLGTVINQKTTLVTEYATTSSSPAGIADPANAVVSNMSDINLRTLITAPTASGTAADEQSTEVGVNPSTPRPFSTDLMITQDTLVDIENASGVTDNTVINIPGIVSGDTQAMTTLNTANNNLPPGFN